MIAHGDLGPGHLLVTGGRVSGVIDWTDAALDQHRLGPWWEVVYGLEERLSSYVESGLVGILDRL